MPSLSRVRLLVSLLVPLAACSGGTKGTVDAGGEPEQPCGVDRRCDAGLSLDVQAAHDLAAATETGAGVDSPTARDGSLDGPAVRDAGLVSDSLGGDVPGDSPVGSNPDDARDAAAGGDGASVADRPGKDAVDALQLRDTAAPDTNSLPVTWQSLNTVKPDGGTQTINALAYHEGVLYAGGDFVGVGSVAGNGVVAWDGKKWALVGEGSVKGEVSALVVDGVGSLYAGGQFEAVGAAAATDVAKWDGQAWSALPGGPTGPVRALAVDDKNALSAGGDAYWKTSSEDMWYRDYYVDTWQRSGQTWKLSTTDSLGECRRFMDVDNTCGPFEGLSVHMMVWVPGQGILYGGASSNFISRNINSNNYMVSMGAFAADSAGGFYVGGQKKYYLYTRTTGEGIFAKSEDVFSQPIDCVRKYTWTNSVGKFTEIVLQAQGLSSVYINAMAVDNAGNLYFGGSFDIKPGAHNIALWDGKQIRPLGSGVDGEVKALALNERGDRLFVGGKFDTAGGVFSPMVVAVDLGTTGR